MLGSHIPLHGKSHILWRMFSVYIHSCSLLEIPSLTQCCSQADTLNIVRSKFYSLGSALTWSHPCFSSTRWSCFLIYRSRFVFPPLLLKVLVSPSVFFSLWCLRLNSRNSLFLAQISPPSVPLASSPTFNYRAIFLLSSSSYVCN